MTNDGPIWRWIENDAIRISGFLIVGEMGRTRPNDVLTPCVNGARLAVLGLLGNAVSTLQAGPSVAEPSSAGSALPLGRKQLLPLGVVMEVVKRFVPSKFSESSTTFK